jgi:hypothetical protein
MKRGVQLGLVMTALLAGPAVAQQWSGVTGYKLRNGTMEPLDVAAQAICGQDIRPLIAGGRLRLKPGDVDVIEAPKGGCRVRIELWVGAVRMGSALLGPPGGYQVMAGSRKGVLRVEKAT